MEIDRAPGEAWGGEILGGGVTRNINGATGTLRVRVDAARLSAAVEQREYEKKPEGCREVGLVSLAIRTPPRIIESDEGIGPFFRDAIAGSARGILWSLEMLVVGAAHLGPWLIVILLVAFLVRRRRKRAATTAR